MKLKKRDEIDINDTWELKRLYPDLTAWEDEYKTLEKELATIEQFKSRVGDSAETLFQTIDKWFSLSKTFEKLYCYAHLLADQDTGNAENQGLLQRALIIYSRYNSATSFIRPELLAIPDDVLATYLVKPTLKPYVRAIKDIVRYKPHILDESRENLLALATEVLSAPSTIFSQLNNADLKFGSIIENGEEKPLTHSSYYVFLRSKERALRREAFEKHCGAYESHKNTIAATFTASVKRDIFSARARGYRSALEMSLFPDQVPLTVYETLIETVNKNLDAFQEYYRLRNRILGLDRSEMYDLVTPLVKDINLSFDYNEACQIIVDSLAPLGEEYQSVLAAGLINDRWVDRYENEGKRSGAYQSSCYKFPPYILMNYKADTIDSMYTLAHEAGHAMHTYFSSNNQPYQDHDYPIFTAEVASTFNEQLLSHYLLSQKITTPLERAYIINHQIDEIVGTFFRQTLFAEFEKLVHDAGESNQPLTVDVYRAIYGQLLAKHYGDTANITTLADLGALRIPHFYSAFYVYKYATGISAAIALSEQVLNGGPIARDRYLAFLKSGCTKPPIELLKVAGVDLNSPQPIETTIKTFRGLVKQLSEFDL